MDKKEGIHIYININNLNSVLLDEESGTGRVEHTLHAMNLFFSSVEQYGKQLSRNLVKEIYLDYIFILQMMLLLLMKN